MRTKKFFTLGALLVTALSVSVELCADTFTFYDLTDNVTLEHTGTQRTSYPVTHCIFTGQCESVETAIRSNNGAFTVDYGSFPLINVGGEADGKTLSDQIWINYFGYHSVQANLSFVSLYAEAGPGGCALPPGCTLTENGMVQIAGYIYWNDGTKDTVQFQSDVEPNTTASEPGSLVLLGTGLLGLVGVVHRSWLG